jgi:thiol:disulfide interchange protein DsbA
VEGADYQVIPNGQPFQPAAGKIEVTEIFGYVCPACAFAVPRVVGPWKQPAYVRRELVLRAGHPSADYRLCPCLTPPTAGRAGKTHEALYAAIHSRRP